MVGIEVRRREGEGAGGRASGVPGMPWLALDHGVEGHALGTRDPGRGGTAPGVAQGGRSRIPRA